MKKLVCTLTLISLVSAGIYAQGISGGLKGGLNLSSLGMEGLVEDTKMKAGFHLGAYATIMFTENIGLQPEVLYSAQGCKTEEGSEDININVNYLTVPVLFRYNINEMIHLHAGPQVGFLMKAEADVDGGSGDLDEYFTSTDIGGAVGGGVELPLGLGFGARYVFGLSNVLGIEEAQDEYTWKNNNIQIFVSYKLFGKK